MGGCVRKVEQTVVPSHASDLLVEKLNERRVKSSLLDLKKARCAPVLSLESNARFNSRLSKFSRKQVIIDSGDTLCFEGTQRPASPLSLLLQSRCH